LKSRTHFFAVSLTVKAASFYSATVICGLNTMSKVNNLQEKANSYDKVGVAKAEAAKDLTALKSFRLRYPFAENLASIEWLEQDKLFKVNPDEVGDFFVFLDGFFKPFGASMANSKNVYRNARLQIKEFRNLLRTAVDDRKTLAQKVDAAWERIGGVSPDKELAKKIIFCFNYDRGTVLPVLSDQHLRHFVNRIVDSPSGQTKYYSPGQEYEHYTSELLKTKNSVPLTKGWDVLYFTRFLYQTYPPPDSEPITNDTSTPKKNVTVTEEQLDMQGFMKLLGELQKQGKITGDEFRENRQLWMQAKPNDRELLAIRLRQLLKAEAPISNRPKNHPIQRLKM
jgi:hypothetical protein